MGCTTILVGKKATYDGSTMIARNDDSGAGHLQRRSLQWFLRSSSRKPIIPCSLM